MSTFLIRSFLKLSLTFGYRSINSRFEPELAIRVGHISGMSLCYTIRGSWTFFRPRDIRFSLPNFVPLSLIEPFISYLPAQVDLELAAAQAEELDLKVPRELGFPILEILKAFSTESEAAYRTHSEALNNAHDKVAHETEVRFMTLQDLASKLLYGDSGSSRATPFSALYALHKALTRMNYGFQVDRHNHRATGSFEIRPKSEVRLFKTMEKWIHEYQESLAENSHDSQVITAKDCSPNAPGQPIRSFLETARKLVAKSRQTRTATHSDGIGPYSAKKPPTLDSSQPVRKLETGPKFSDTDQVIIAFLDAWAGRSQIPDSTPASSLGSLIVRATGQYKDEDVSSAAGFRLLQEIGVYSPWEDRNALESRLCVPRVDHSSGTQKNENMAHRVQIDPSPEEMIDTMYDMRRDFKDLDVYCIDSKMTSEIDDGISVEPVPGPTPTYWVHVHIAHPTAFIAPRHPISRVAEYQSYTIYLPEHIYPMLPEGLVQSKLSLAKNRATLTISARLNEDGDVVERKVTPGIIRNVTYLTPSTLDQIIRPQKPSRDDDSFVLRVGGDLPQLGRTNLRGLQELSASQLDGLRILGSLIAKRYFGRDDIGRNSVRPTMHELIAYSGPERTDALSRDRRLPCFWQGDPIIELRTPRWESMRDEPETVGAEIIVGETMVLACETAARWCGERGIPIPYRGTVDVGKDPLHVITEAKSPSASEAQDVGSSTKRWIHDDSRELVFDFASTPLPHFVMGINMYTRATSPLRRFGDMLVHWQIDAALREEARTGRSLVGDSRTDYLPFSKDDMEALIARVRERHLLSTRLKHRSNQHWLMQLLVRAAFHGQAALPKTFECFMLALTKWGRVGYIKLLHLRATVEPVPWLDVSQLEEQDELEVELAGISTYQRRLYVKPIRLIRRAAEQTPLDIWRMRRVAMWGY